MNNELNEVLERIEFVRNELIDEGYNGLVEELNQAHYSIQLLLEEIKGVFK
jgi:ribosomal 50S subunit-associated protein YjgA (DUF615 family)